MSGSDTRALALWTDGIDDEDTRLLAEGYWHSLRAADLMDDIDDEVMG